MTELPGAKTGIIVENDPNEKQLKVLFAQLEEQRRANQMLYDYSHPVDEFEFNETGVDITQMPGEQIVIQPAYSSTVRIETVTAVLPVGITSATLQLGQRRIPLVSVAAATTALTVMNLHGMGIILNGSDDRFLSWVSPAVVTSGYYIALSGHTNYRG